MAFVANVEIDPVQYMQFVKDTAGELKDTITDVIHDGANREAFVKGLMEKVSAEYPDHNVMVFNMQQGYNKDFKAENFQQVEYDSALRDIPFGVWAFKEGSFENLGDGGWINWAFSGDFDRNGSHVQFHSPTGEQEEVAARADVPAIEVEPADGVSEDPLNHMELTVDDNIVDTCPADIPDCTEPMFAMDYTTPGIFGV